MKIHIAKTAGFCEGVQKAINRTVEIASRKNPGEKIYTFGPLIHNPQTLSLLKKQGVEILKDLIDASQKEIVIRTHGVPPAEYQELKSRCNKLYNATCPKVGRVQSIIRKYIQNGSRVIIIGDRGHAEIKGLLGFSSGKGVVVRNVSEAEALDECRSAMVVCQTTFDYEEFEDVIGVLKKKIPDLTVHNTICGSTRDRQTEIKEMCGYVDAMVVVGGKESANTGRLVSICRDLGVRALHAERLDEIKASDFTGLRQVGVTAGASTPRWLINNMLEKIESLDTRSFRGNIRRLAKFCVYSYLLLGTAAAALSYVFTTYMETSRDFSYAAMAFLYVYALYNINTYFLRSGSWDAEASQSGFFRDHRLWISGTTFLALAGTLLISFFAGMLSFVTVVLSIVLGILFNVELFFGWLRRTVSIKSLKDIPGSKDIFTPLAWATVIVLVPVFADASHGGLQAGISFLITTALIFLRSTLLHLVDIEEDRMVGRDTIPTYLGEKTTVRIATYTIMGFILTLFLLSWSGIGWPGSFLFSINAAAVLLFIRLYRRKVIMRYYLFSLALDLNLVSAAVVAYVGKLFIS